MNCNEIIELLPLYIEKMLSDDEMTAVSEHLAVCKTCSEELSFLLSVKEGFGNLEEIEPSEEFKSRLHARLIEEGKKRSVKPRPLKMIKRSFAVAASVAVIAISVMTLDTGVFELGKASDVLGAKTENDQSALKGELSMPTGELEGTSDDEKIEPAPTLQKTEKTNSSNDTAAKAAAGQGKIPDVHTEQADRSAVDEANVSVEPAAFEEDYLEKAEAAPDGAIEQRSIIAFAGYEKVSFYPETLNDEALLVLADYEEENGIYKISLDEFYDVTGKLMMICGGDYKTENLNEEYNELLSGGDENSEALLEIEEICNWGYIVVEK